MSEGIQQETFVLDPLKARKFCTSIFVEHHVPEEEGYIVADSLVSSNLRGLDSHGITRMGIYVERLKKKLVNPTPNVKVLKEKGAIVHIDGDNGMGAVVTHKATEMGIERTKSFGVCSVSITHSNHYGAGAYYIKQALEHNLACHLYGNAPPTMAPHGGAEPFLGTNPYSFGVPAGKYGPLILDMASSVVARGKVILAAKEGTAIPEGWAIDIQGYPTTDAPAALAGSVLPFAGPKGYGIALMNDILAGVLSQSNYGKNIPDLYRNMEDIQNIGAFIQLTDINEFTPIEVFIRNIEDFISELKRVKLAPSYKHIYIPGEIEENLEKERLVEGFPVSLTEITMLKELGQPLGLHIDDIISRRKDI